MKPTAWPLLALLAAVGLTLFALARVPQPAAMAEAREGRAERGEPGAVVPAEAALAPAPGQVLREEVAPDRADAPVRFQVRVVDRAGGVIEHARVELFESAAGPTRRRWTRVGPAAQVAITGPEGTADLATRAERFEILAIAPDGSRAACREWAAASSNGTIELVTRMACSLRVTVRDERDQPLADVPIQLDPLFLATGDAGSLDGNWTDAAGACEIDLFQEGAYLVRAGDPEATQTVVVVARAGARAEVVLHRFGRWSLAVTVHDAAGNLAEDAWVRLQPHGKPARGAFFPKLSSDVRVEQPGEVRVPVPAPGKYRVQAYGPEGERSDLVTLELTERDYVVPLRLMLR